VADGRRAPAGPALAAAPPWVDPERGQSLPQQECMAARGYTVRCARRRRRDAGMGRRSIRLLSDCCGANGSLGFAAGRSL